MSLNGISISLLLALVAGVLPYFIGISGTLVVISLSYIFLGIIYIKRRDIFQEIIKFKNIDRYMAYEKKDKEFKDYVKENPYSYFLIAGILIYFAYRFLWIDFSMRYSFIIGIFIIANYLIEVYAMTTSKDWVSYRKKSAMVGMVLVFIVLFLF